MEDEPLQLPDRVPSEAEVGQVPQVDLLGLDGLVDAAQGQVVVVQDEVSQGAGFKVSGQSVASLIALVLINCQQLSSSDMFFVRLARIHSTRASFLRSKTDSSGYGIKTKI